MFQVNQRVRVTAPAALRIIERDKLSTVGTIVAIVPDSRWPVKVLLDGCEKSAIPFCFVGKPLLFNFSFTDDGRHSHGDLKPGIELVNL